MRYIKRAKEDTFLELNREFPAIFLTGPRQVGKTTMLKKLMNEENRSRSYVTLDDLTERRMAKEDPAMFFQIHRPLCSLMKSSMHRSFSRISKCGLMRIAGQEIFGLQDPKSSN